MTKAIDYRAELSTLQAARRMGPDLLSAELGTTRELLRWWQLGSAPETDKQARALADLEASVRRYLRANQHTLPDAKVRTHVRTKNLGPTKHRRPTLDVHQEARRQAALALCDIMRRRGLRDTETATIAGLNKSTICSWRQGERVPTHDSIDQMQRLVRVTGDLTGTERGSNSRKTHHPMMGDLAARMAGQPEFTYEAKSDTVNVAKAIGTCDSYSLLMPPSGISREDSTEVHLTTPVPHRVPLFTTEQDLAVIRRVSDVIENMQLAGLSVLVWLWRRPWKSDYDMLAESAIVRIILLVVLPIYFLVCALGYYPYQKQYHYWSPVSGVVTQSNSRIVSQGGVQQKIVVALDTYPNDAFGCLDTRCALLEQGDTLHLLCKRVYEWAAKDGWDCKFQAMEKAS
jgi:transcriptional regulator with XRE-family HTH domain